LCQAIANKKNCFLLLICFSVSGIKGQAVFTTAGTYTQNFGTLVQPSWTDNTTYLGWYALSYQISTLGTDPYRGTTNIQTAVIPPNPGGWSVYQCNSGTDMKLGTRPSNSSGGPDVPGLDGRRGIGLGLCLQNNLSAAIASIRVDFDWYQLSLAENGNEPNNFFLSYFVSASNLIGIDLPNNAHPYTNVGAANYTVPNNTASCCSSQLTSYPCNVTGHISVCIPVSIALNSYIMLRWWDPNNGNNDHHSAIDNISVTAYSDNACLVVLPVELVSFSAKHKGDNVELDWLTASEKNNNYFTVERSRDLINFEKIGIVKGAGNSNKPLKYKHYDNNPFISGVSYYRLRQTDFNGTFSFSQIVAIDNNGDNPDADIKLLPNPTEGKEVKIVVSDKVKLPVSAEILDYSGRPVLQINLQSPVTNISLSEFAEGMYFVKLNSNGKLITRKLLVH